MSAQPSASPDPLRIFLRDRMTPERIRVIASADYNFHTDSMAEEFKRNLDTGVCEYTGEGNMYECALLMRHDDGADRALNMLFAAWWMGTFCSSPELFVLISNLVHGGVQSILDMTVVGCDELGEDSREAAKAAIPFVHFLHPRTPRPDEELFNLTFTNLDSIARTGKMATNAD